MGHLYGVGWNRGHSQWFGPQSIASEMTTRMSEVYADLLALPTVNLFLQGQAALKRAMNAASDGAGDTLVSLPDNSFGVNGATAFLSFCYSAVDRPHADAIPRDVVMSMAPSPYDKSCRRSCQACIDSECLQCRSCPMHKDKYDRTLTLLVLYQSPRVPATHQSRFMVNGQAFGIAGGRCFIFNGKHPHGVFADGQCSAKRYPWYGIAIVARSL
jgi:hypothetical protein